MSDSSYSQNPSPQPQSTGDIVGCAVRVYLVNIKRWAPLLFWPTITVLFGRVIYQVSIALMPEVGMGFIAYCGLLTGFIVVLLGKWHLLQTQLAFARLATGFAANLESAVTYLKSRKWAIVGLVLLTGIICLAIFTLWTLVIFAASVLVKTLTGVAWLAMLAGFIGLIVSVTFIVLSLFMSLTTLACEADTVTGTLSRGFTLASRNFFRTLFCGLIAAVTVNCLATPLWAPLLILGGLDSLRAGAAVSSGASLPVYWQVTIAAWETLVEMITQPILFLVYAFYYYDLRLRYEGIDILESLDALKLKQQANLADYG